MAAMFFNESKFHKQFLKRVTQEILWNYFRIWQAVSEEKNFDEFLWSPHREKSPPWQPYFSKGQNFTNNFWKGSHNEQSCENIPNSDQRFRRRRFFKNFFMSAHCKIPPPHPLRPFFSTDQNFTNTFWKGSPKEQSCEIISKSDNQFQRRSFKEFFHVHIVLVYPFFMSI